MKKYDYHFSLGEHISRINKIQTSNGDYLRGLVFTKFGAVSVYSQGNEYHSHSTRLEFFSGKKVFVRQINKRYAERGLIIQAKKFAKELANK